ncbi:MAG TPA: NUDIX domain-containing protein [Usitatibacter sp.]|nr:NUDIX domain-containing protein [Usitatibacter sp.]
MKSAGILLYRRGARGLEVLLGHPGGPFWRGRDEGAWTIPKGEIGEDEDPFAAAQREFREETGFEAPGTALALTPLRQPSRKWVYVWAIEGDCDTTQASSNTFSMEWPPRSGRLQDFPELDRVEWFATDEAAKRILRGQAPFVDELRRLLEKDSP